MVTRPTSLKLVDGSEQYGVVIIADEKGNLLKTYEITAEELRAIQAGAPIAEGLRAVVVGKPLRKGEAMLDKNGGLIAKVDDFINAKGVMDCECVRLYPEEWKLVGKSVEVDIAAASVAPKLLTAVADIPVKGM